MDLSLLIIKLQKDLQIDEIIKKLKSFGDEEKIKFEILVLGKCLPAKNITANDNVKYFPIKTSSYGLILKEALSHARGKYIITIDPEAKLKIEFIKNLYNHRHMADCIVASRYIKDGKAYIPAIRHIFSKVLNFLFSYFLVVPYRDLTGSIRLYNKEIFEKISFESNSFDILIEIIIKAHSNGFSIIEIPIEYENNKIGKSPIFLAKDYIKTFLKMWKLRNSILSVDYDERAFNSKIFLQRYWQRKRYKIIYEFLEPQKSNKSLYIIDLGCGSSKIIQNIPDGIGLDISFNKLKYLRQKKTITVNANVGALPFKDKTFDKIICSQLIEHLNKSVNVFGEIARTIKDNGILIIGTPDYDSQMWRFFEFFYKKLLPNAYADEHINKFTKSTLFIILKKYNFKVVSYKYILKGELIVKAFKEP